MTKHHHKKSVSYGHVRISRGEAARWSKAWLKKVLPKRQMKVVAPLLKNSIVPDVVQPVIKILRTIKINQPTLLDVGSSGGHYYDFFKRSRLNLKYQGCDFSNHFIKLAKKLHPNVKFLKANITKLPYKDNEFDIVLASGIIDLEINYKKAIKEISRIASKYIIIHRLPVFDKNEKTKYFQKMGYDIKMMEIYFDPRELKKIFTINHLAVIDFFNNDSSNLTINRVGPAHRRTILLKKLKGSKNSIIVQTLGYALRFKFNLYSRFIMSMYQDIIVNKI